MDRDQLDAWLTAPAKTWRWRHDDDYDRYEAVEARSEGLRWFAHSHVPGEDGVYREERQTWEAFDADGPLWDAPASVVEALRAFRVP